MRDLLGIDSVLQAWPEGLDLVRVVVSRGQDLEEAENNLTTAGKSQYFLSISSVPEPCKVTPGCLLCRKGCGRHTHPRQ